MTSCTEPPRRRSDSLMYRRCLQLQAAVYWRGCRSTRCGPRTFINRRLTPTISYQIVCFLEFSWEHYRSIDRSRQPTMSSSNHDKTENQFCQSVKFSGQRIVLLKISVSDWWMHDKFVWDQHLEFLNWVRQFHKRILIRILSTLMSRGSLI